MKCSSCSSAFCSRYQGLSCRAQKIAVLFFVVLLATGWGQLSANGQVPHLLQTVNLAANCDEKCKADVSTIIDVHASHLCTFTKAGEGVCYGDSEGPLVSGDEVVGLASWTAFGCGRGYPDGFTRISYLYDWIVANIK